MTGVEAVLREAVEATRVKHAIPALGAAIVTAEPGEEPPAWVVGVRVRGREDPATVEDRWHIGSCAKAMTGALYARLVERGDAAWDATLRELFPDLEGIDPGWSSTPIDRVLTHRAGLPANLDRADLEAWFDDDRPVTDQRSDATRSGPVTAPPEAGLVPLLEPRLHRRRGGDRADLPPVLGGSRHGRCPAPPGHRLGRLRGSDGRAAVGTSSPAAGRGARRSGRPGTRRAAERPRRQPTRDEPRRSAPPLPR